MPHPKDKVVIKFHRKWTLLFLLWITQAHSWASPPDLHSFLNVFPLQSILQVLFPAHNVDLIGLDGNWWWNVVHRWYRKRCSSWGHVPNLCRLLCQQPLCVTLLLRSKKISTALRLRGVLMPLKQQFCWPAPTLSELFHYSPVAFRRQMYQDLHFPGKRHEVKTIYQILQYLPEGRSCSASRYLGQDLSQVSFTDIKDDNTPLFLAPL